MHNHKNDKKKRILDVAIHEIATLGYQAANVNVIAKKADVSVGTLYNYFSSKQDLFLSIVDLGQNVLVRILAELKAKKQDEDSFFDVLEHLFCMTFEYSHKYSELSLIYLDLSTEKYSQNIALYTNNLEKHFMVFYRALLSDAVDKGEIIASVDIDMMSFLLDNIVIMLQFANSSSYYRMRLLAYLNLEKMPDGNVLSKKIVQQLKLLLT